MPLTNQEAKVINLCSKGRQLSTAFFDNSGNAIVPKDSSITAAKLAAGGKSLPAEITLVATTSTAMTTNATLFGTFVAPVAGVITNAYYVPVSAVTGANTDTFNVNVVNRGSGTGTSQVVSRSYVSGVDAVGYGANSLGTITTTAGSLAAQDVVVAQYQKVGSGQNAPAGSVCLVFRPS